MKNKRGSVPKTKLKGRYKKMKVNFDDKVRTFKTLEGITITQNRLELLVIMKASELSGRQILDVKQATLILEKKGIKLSSLFSGIGRPLTLKAVCTETLNISETNERGRQIESAEVRYKKGKLMKRIFEAKEEISLDSKEITLAKESIARSNYLNVVLQQAFDWLEGEEDKKE